MKPLIKNQIAEAIRRAGLQEITGGGFKWQMF
jgi:hypothetical protein